MLLAKNPCSQSPVAADAIIGMASLVDALECAELRKEARHKAEAEAVLCGMPKVVVRTDLGQLRGLFKQSSNVAMFFCVFALIFFEIGHGAGVRWKGATRQWVRLGGTWVQLAVTAVQLTNTCLHTSKAACVLL